MATSFPSLIPSRSPSVHPSLNRIQRCILGCKQASRAFPPARREELRSRSRAALPSDGPDATSATATAAWLASTPSTTTSTTSTTAPPPPYIPSPYTPGPEIWLGALLPTLVFLLGSYEFGKRILIQRRCAVCSGTGLVDVPFSPGSSSSSSPNPSSSPPSFRKVKCRACGGFFPWESAEKVFSAATRPGNGGPLRQPQFPRQTSVLYRVPSAEEARRAAREMRERKSLGVEAEEDDAE